MTASSWELAGMLAGCGAAALAILARDPRLRLGAIAVAMTIAPVLVAGDVWHQPRVVLFREDTAQVAAVAVAAVVVVLALAVLLARFPAAFGVLALALLPLRVPVEIGGETANLLIPLYALIAGAVAAALWTTWRGGSGAGRDSGPGAVVGLSRDPASWLRWILALTLVAYAVQSAYSRDVSNAIENAGFFLIPFAVMFALLLEIRWSRRLLTAALVAVGAMATLFAGIAIYQWVARDLFLNSELLESNQLHQYFRVNSLFFDPNILGRYLALAITAGAAVVAWTDDRRAHAAGAALAGFALVAVGFTFSITSVAALVAGLATLAVIRWRIRGAALTAALGVAAAAVFLGAGGVPSTDLERDRGFDSGRGDLVSGGLELADERPVAGWGSGSFGVAYWEEIEPVRMTISHAEPVTVAAEQGSLGFLVYVALVVAAIVVLFTGRDARTPARPAVAACFVVMLVHSFGYAGFAIDPATWALLALGVSLRERPPD